MRTGHGCVVDSAGAMTSAAEQGYAELVARHSEPIRAYAIRLTRNRSTAEDVTQETLLRAWRHSAPPGTVKSRAHYAMRVLRADLAPRTTATR